MICGSIILDFSVGFLVSRRIGPGSKGSILLSEMLLDHSSSMLLLMESSSVVGLALIGQSSDMFGVSGVGLI
jgi:hypothetical protein